MSTTTAAPAVLLIDCTGRGHALCDLFVRTHPTVEVHYAPGCPLVASDRVHPTPSVRVDDVQTALDFLAGTPVDLVFVSHIDALSAGYVDVLRAAGHRVVGPTAAAAELESSKRRGKRFCLDHGVPIAAHLTTTDVQEALQHVRSVPYRCVVKADGLTPDGDGAVVCDDAAAAERAVLRLAEQQGDAFCAVVEERLAGVEVSLFALVDGQHALVLPLAMDYKRTLDGDAGVNCDGMGSVCPHPLESEPGSDLRSLVQDEVLAPVLAGLRAEGLDFTGFLYLGVMLTADGPRVLEINARFGDSEAEVVLPGLRSDFLDLCHAVLGRELATRRLDVDGLSRCSVALVQGRLPQDAADPTAPPGWPFGAFRAGQPIHGLSDVDPQEATVFCANVDVDADGVPVTAGGRVLHVVGHGTTAEQARRSAYRQADRIDFAGRRLRHDVGAATVPDVTAANRILEVTR